MSLLEAVILTGTVLLLAYYLGIYRGAPFLPTYVQTVDRMIRMAEIKPREKLADLGSGDGRIVIAAAKAGAVATGFEINPALALWSRLRIRQAGVSDRAGIRMMNFWRQDFGQFDIVAVFGIKSIMPQLEAKLRAELKPGARIICNIFPLPNLQAESKSGECTNTA